MARRPSVWPISPTSSSTAPAMRSASAVSRGRRAQPALPYQDERHGQQRVRHQESEAGAPAIAEPPEENALHGLMRTRKSRP